MTVLVAHASRHGSTAGIAEQIAAGLREAGLEAVAQPVRSVRDVSRYDAFVIGGAAYMFHWMKEATAFVRRHRAVLARRPVWLFSSGPLGTDLVDEQGRDIFEATRPKEFDELEALVRPRGSKVFFGAWDPSAPVVGWGERFLRLMPAARASLPVGDFRDWPAIHAWAVEIATALRSVESAAPDRSA